MDNNCLQLQLQADADMKIVNTSSPQKKKTKSTYPDENSMLVIHHHTSILDSHTFPANWEEANSFFSLSVRLILLTHNDNNKSQLDMEGYWIYLLNLFQMDLQIHAHHRACYPHEVVTSNDRRMNNYKAVTKVYI
jgi:hypothetical protein